MLLFLNVAASCGSLDQDKSNPTVDDDTGDDDTATDDDSFDEDLADDDTGDDDDFDAPACLEYDQPLEVGTVESPEVIELSGLAVSAQNPGVMWGLNDSGDGPYLYAMTTEGLHLGVVTVNGAFNLDWEDLALGNCEQAECLYLADIGDNLQFRPTKSVYRVLEPFVDPSKPFGFMTLDLFDKLTFNYPDGKPDAEALAVHPNGGIYVISKLSSVGEGGLYVFPEIDPNKVVTLEKLGILDLTVEGSPEKATAADIHRSGLRLLVRTYRTALEWRLDSGQSFSEILNAPRLTVPCADERQGEAIAYDPATGNYLHSSESGSGPLSPIYRIECLAD